MPRGQFLSDLGSGIFERLGQLRDEQTRKDEGRRGEALQFLGSLADKIEPESLPVLMRTMADVGNFKGKVRNVWDALSGMPNRSVEDQIGTSLRDAMGLTTGAGTARAARGKAVTNLALDAFSGGPSSSPQTLNEASGMTGRMVFRDPRQERLTEIEQRYGAQNELNLHKLAVTQDFQRRQQEDRQLHDKAMVEERANAKAKEAVMERAWRISSVKGFIEPTPAIISQAAKELGVRDDLVGQLLQARIGLTGALQTKAESEAKAYKEGGGISPTAQANIEDRRRGAANAIKKEHEKALEDIVKANKTMSDIATGLQKQLEAGKSGARFDPNTGNIIPDPNNPGSQYIGILFEDQLNAYRKAAAEKAGAEEVAKGRWGTLKIGPNSKYYRVGTSFMDPIEEVVTPQKKGAIKPQQPSRPGPRAGISTTRSQRSIPISDPMKYEVGGRIKYQGTWYKITGLGVDSLMVVPE